MLDVVCILLATCGVKSQPPHSVGRGGVKYHLLVLRDVEGREQARVDERALKAYGSEKDIRNPTANLENTVVKDVEEILQGGRWTGDE